MLTEAASSSLINLNEERFRALVTATSDVVYRMSPDWREMHYLQGRGCIADTSVPTQIWLDKYIPSDEQPRVMEAINKAIQTKNVLQLEHRIFRKDGSIGWAFSRAVPILSHEGDIIEWFGAVSDIPLHSEIEERLQNSKVEAERQKRLYETILNNTPDLAYIFDLNHRFVYANEVLLKTWGRTWGEAIGKNCLELGYEPWQAAMHDREIEQVIATRKPIKGEAPFTGTLGKRIYEYIFVPILGENGTVEAIAGTTRDVTERKEAEEALRASNKQFETLLDAAPLGVFVVDADFRIRHANPVAFSVFGDIPGGVKYNDLSNVIYFIWEKEHANDVISAFKHTLETGESYSVEECVEFRIDRKVLEYYQWQVARITLSNGGHGVVCYFRDISSQVQSRMAIAKTRDEAEAANRAKSEFLANMSHEIRTPMNAVVGLASILAIDTTLTSKQKEMVHTLQLSAESLLKLINDLLDIAKIETQQTSLEHIPFNLHDVLIEVATMLDVKAHEKGIVLSVLPSSLKEQQFLGDPLRIQQIVSNLVSNAIKFTDKGNVTLNATAKPHKEPKFRQVHITVSDTGIGIAPHQQKEIFEKFIQADTSITRKYGGTGLGLTISKSLVEIMGGSITVKSELGRGSQFIVHLPLELSDRKEARVHAKAPVKLPRMAKRGHILLVEDYKPNVLVATHMLQNLGYMCDVASNGEEALSKIRAGHDKYMAVLMDVQMPEIDGFAATRLIREEEDAQHSPRLPIIAMTAHALQGDEERCLESGMDSYISKPFQLQELKDKLASVIDRLKEDV